MYHYISEYNKFVPNAVTMETTDGRYGAMNSDGRTVIPFEYRFIGKFVNGIGVAQKVRYGYIDEKGKVIIPFIYDFASGFDEGAAIVKQGDKYGFIKMPDKK